MKDTTATRNPLTSKSEEARIKREEAYCWKAYWKEKKAQEAKDAAEIEAIFKLLETTDTPPATLPEEIVLKDSRVAGSQRRRNAAMSKKRTKKNAAEAAANRKVRKANDDKNGDHRQTLKTDKLIKRADKISPKKKTGN